MSLDRKTSLSEGQQEDVGRGDGGMGGVISRIHERDQILKQVQRA